MKCDHIRKRKQGDTPFFPNMLNNGNVEVCLKEDVDAAIAELKEKLMPCLNGDCILTCEVVEKYGKENAELKAENERLNNALDKERSETIKYMDELCNAKNEIERLTIDKRNDELRADVADGTVEKLKAENAELKQKLEDAKATAYAESVDAGMRERRLKRALYKACANWARSQRYTEATWHGDEHREELWAEVEHKCRAKGEEYK